MFLEKVQNLRTYFFEFTHIFQNRHDKAFHFFLHITAVQNTIFFNSTLFTDNPLEPGYNSSYISKHIYNRHSEIFCIKENILAGILYSFFFPFNFPIPKFLRGEGRGLTPDTYFFTSHCFFSCYTPELLSSTLTSNHSFLLKSIQCDLYHTS